MILRNVMCDSLVRASIPFFFAVILGSLNACSESPADPCERGAVVPVGCVPGHDAPTVLATSEQPPTTSNKIPKSPSSLHLALDETDVYFTALDGAIMRVAKSGGTPVTFASAPTSLDPAQTCLVSALTVGSEHVYWSVNCGHLEECEAGAVLECVTGGVVSRAPKASGDHPEVVFEQAGGHIDALLADGPELYASASAFGTTSLHELTRRVSLQSLGADFAGTIAVGPTAIYWGGRTIRRTSEIFAISKEGSRSSSLSPLVKTAGVIETFVAYDDDLYWVERAATSGPVSREVKHRANTSEDGEAAGVAIVTGEQTPTTIVADATGIYGMAGDAPNAVDRFTPGEWRRERLALLGVIDQVADLKVDATHLYWVDYKQECTATSVCTEHKLVSRVGKLPK